MKRWFALSLSTAFFCTAVLAQAPAPTDKPVRLRGTVQSYDGTALVVKERSGETISLALDAKVGVTEAVPIEIGAIKAGSYIGTAAMPAADGALTALEVLVFPEAARGTGEGFSAWDLMPGSTMTNATVADVVSAPEGRTMKVRYKDGEKTVVIPTSVPIVTIKPADKSLLVPGAKVIVTALLKDGKPTAMRITAGRNGFTPPM
jgi:hypothetical protein